ncbi:Na/Pi cotransporter family protein [Stutzerimonas tarimensis]|uniref:Na/Pi cotransporter family protein n=1 Tax=Stutzerimonas tarimensis TaxID=1507735 RepID=A0ABV7T6X1_9GAMM
MPPVSKSSLRKQLALVVPALLFVGLATSFWFSADWLQLCAGLALFLFGMQCLEEGLRQMAGGQLERLLARSTASPLKSLLFGLVGTTLLQSSSLVSLLTIAFISTGLIGLAGGIAVIFGANLGSTTGIWLLALVGQNFSLSPLALPLLVLGVLAGFFGPRSKAAGRIVLGVAFIFLAIDQLRAGFDGLGSGFDLSGGHWTGGSGQLLFVGIGLLATVVLQSSHATLMLTLAALASGQIELWQALTLAIGANVGTSVSTAIVGMLGGNRSGQRLALAHVLFNVTTALVVFSLLRPLSWLVEASVTTLGGSELIQLALFQSLFNIIGVSLFWPWQRRLAALLERLLADRPEPQVLIGDTLAGAALDAEVVHARYLNEAALASAESAAQAAVLELRHLERLSLEVICHALYQPVDQLSRAQVDESLLRARPGPEALDAEQLYRRYIKGVYADLLSFISHLDAAQVEAQQSFWVTCQVVALHLVDAVKDAKHLQKNLGHYLGDEHSLVHEHYLELRRQLLWALREIREVARLDLPGHLLTSRLEWLDGQAAEYDRRFRARLFAEVRERRLDGLAASSLMNDLGYASRIIQSLRNVVAVGKGAADQASEVWRTPLADEDGPLIRL